MADIVLQASLSSIRRGFEDLQKNAEKVTQAFTPSGNGADDLAQAAIGIGQAKQEIHSGAKLSKLSRELNKSVLDILA